VVSLDDVLLMKGLRRNRQRLGLRKFCNHEPETDIPVPCFGQRCEAICRTKSIDRRIVTAAPGNAEFAIDITCRIDLKTSFTRAILVQAPFLDIAVHIVKPPTIGRGSTYSKRDTLGTRPPQFPTVILINSFGSMSPA
jgi:hypothetical protein